MRKPTPSRCIPTTAPVTSAGRLHHATADESHNALPEVQAALGQAHAAADGTEAGQCYKRAAEALLLARDFASARLAYACARPLVGFTANDHYNVGLCCDEAGNAADAIAHYRAALAVGPRHAKVLNNLGKSLGRIGHFEEGEAALREALSLEPGRPNSELNLALNLLSRGDWRAAWPLYESRRKVHAVLPAMPYPEWDGTLRTDRLLLLRAEQGLGDAIQFARFASELGRSGQPVIVQADAKLVALLGSLPRIVTVISNAQQVSTEDRRVVWAPLLSVPGRLGVMPATVPWRGPYLSAEPARQARWAAWLPRGGLRIGIAWQGNPGSSVDLGRSPPLACFAPLADIPGVRLVSLQKGQGEEQLGHVPFGSRVLVPAGDFDAGNSAFLDTAALMTHLDLVITSDTSIAHLAGALGRPTWLMLQRWPDWRWLLDREDSPWYPQMRLFRQVRNGDWVDAFRRIEASARQLLVQRAS